MAGFVVSRSRSRRVSGDVLATPEQGYRDRDKTLRNTLIDCRDAPAFVLEIEKLWDDASDSFLTIGRYLNEAKRILKHGEFEHMVRHQLPFDKNVAHRLRRVAEDIDNGRLHQAEVPKNYTTVYRFVTMSDEMLGRARQEGLVNPAVTHKQVATFLLKLREEDANTGLSLDQQQLVSKKRGLEQEIVEIEAVLHRKRQDLANIDALLGAKPMQVIDGSVEPNRSRVTLLE